MSSFTRLGAALWDWEPWTSLDPEPRIVWLGLYASPEAKRLVPGLFHGSLVQIAEACRTTYGGAVTSLQTLLERELAEYDPKHRVLRLTQLPDAGEWPTNGKVVLGWFTRFKNLPDCPVRNAHVPTIEWLMHTGASAAGKELSADHRKAWDETFGRIPVPAPRRRGVRRLLEDGLGTSSQPSLFDPPKALPPGSDPSSGGSDDPISDHKKTNTLDTLSRPSRKDPDPGSRIPDLGSSSFPEISDLGARDLAPRPPELIPDEPARDQVLRRPALTLVPAFPPEELLLGIARGAGDTIKPEVPPALRAALCTLITQLAGAGVGVEDAPLAGRWLRRIQGGRPTYPARHLPPPERLAAWCVTPGIVLQAVTEQRAQDKIDDAQRADRQAALAEMGEKLGYRVPDVKEITNEPEPEHHDPAVARV